MSTTAEVIKKIDNQIKGATKAFELAVNTVHAQVTQRIFVDGESKNGQIGEYDKTHPLYVSLSESPKKFTPKGKDQKRAKKTETFNIKTRKKERLSIKKDHSERKSGYFESYAAYRKAIGRQVDHVDLTLSGNLQSEFRKLKKEDGEFVASISRGENINKVKGAKHRYGAEVFGVTKKERERIVEIATAETVKAFK